MPTYVPESDEPGVDPMVVLKHPGHSGGDGRARHEQGNREALVAQVSGVPGRDLPVKAGIN